MIELTLKSSPNDKVLPSFNDNIPTKINSQTLKPLFCDFVGNFAIWGSVATIMHLLHGFTPTDTCPTKNSNNRCLGYVVFECHANFQINWESLTNRINKKTRLGYATPKSWRWQMSSMHSWTRSTVNHLRAHYPIWINPKTTNFVESRLSMWHHITNLNMNKRSSWNNQETIRIDVKGVRENCSWPYYGCIGQ